MFDPNKPLVSLTDRAADRVRRLVEKGGADVVGLRVGVSSKGCSGLSYVVEYASEKKQFEEEVDCNGARIFIDPAATMFLVGAEIDYTEDKLKSGFSFTNPNETARCGCGESFSVG
ncbi:iron-sulfur cluster assembly accessory protein [Marivibrio halodurans]|uniref:Iron-sulfur cluster assembly accessory protein n=1 Tax=Marivibrio halodurans TaxID=2039722 RepID=A0A8J7V2I0_9PROT|nr:iron-sulfur cluster assembly accessory protein [Marivibrio halodurans]MBP5856932.1 iron-sulfur cluster assembly accessory protein [Marivibrio halodurans]